MVGQTIRQLQVAGWVSVARPQYQCYTSATGLGCGSMSLPVDSQRDDSPREVRLGEFELDLRTAELRNNGYRFILQGQPFQVMTILLERPGELVTREELKKRLWSSDTFVDFDHSLNKAVNRLREALHDPAEKPRYVETIPRRGYRLIAPVRWMGAPPAQAQLPVREAGIVQGPSVPEDPTEQKFATRRLRWQYAAKLVTALILLVTGLVLLRWRDSSGAKESPEKFIPWPSCPWKISPVTPAQDYFADGMTDELITNLGQHQLITSNFAHFGYAIQRCPQVPFTDCARAKCRGGCRRYSRAIGRPGSHCGSVDPHSSR